MHDEKSSSGKGRKGQRQASVSSGDARHGWRDLKDIAPVLRGWDYEPGSINVRKITGLDGVPKLQMRLDLGLLQMELTGRPDGAKPYGCESLLDYHERRLREHRRRNGTELGFHLSGSQCQSLREEALMYYHRYLSLFVLGDFPSVARDTSRNLRVLDICGKYATDESDRLILEQYRPYIVMMNGRALASIDFEKGNYRRALSVIKESLAEIKDFFQRFGQEKAYKQSNEVKILRRFGREIRKKLPVDPVRHLQKQLNKAVQAERYEDAAKLRDEIERLSPGASGQRA
jgi:hypothetical protein